MDDDDILRKQIGDLNKHLPEGRVPLSELLEADRPRVENRDGSTHRFKREELEYLAGLLPEEERPRLRLPIIVRISPGLGRGAAEITGEIGKKVVRDILDEGGGEDDELVIYRPEVRKIRRKLPTTTQYAFRISTRGGGSSGGKR